MDGRQIVQWDKDSCADAGFLKIDLLGLGMLSAVERCVELIWRSRRERVDLSRIPYDDPATYECIQNADTTGVFQIESRAQMASLRRTRPETLQDITIQVAIVRPGPIQGGAVNPYIERRQRLRVDPGYQVPYEHPSLEAVLGETLGTIIFQDQVLEVAIAFAGFSPGEAEGLRRAMSRKRSEAAIQAYHERFVQGAQDKHGVDAETAERVFAMVKGFSGFGFPKAHGAAFGLLAYQSTWLRVHYTPELLCSLLNEQPMGFYPPDALVHEAQRRGIEVLAPDVNHSGLECDVELAGPAAQRSGAPQPDDGRAAQLDDSGAARSSEAGGRAGGMPESEAGSRAGCRRLRVRIGLGYVRGVRGEEVQGLVAARERGGRFRNLSDLASRAGSSASALELLAWSGACDELAAAGTGVVGSARRIALWQLGVMSPGRRVPGGTQLALPLDLPAPPGLRELSEWEAMLADYSSIGLTAGAHPLALLRDRLPGAATSRDLGVLEHGGRVRVGGLVVARQRPGTAGGVVFILLEDEHGTINLIVPPKIYERHRLVVRTEPLILVEGKLERFAAAGGAINVLVDRVGPIDAPDQILAEVKDFSMLDEQVRRGRAEQQAAAAAAAAAPGGSAASGASASSATGEAGLPGAARSELPPAGEAEDFRAVAPPVMSFASGRRLLTNFRLAAPAAGFSGSSTGRAR